MTPRQLGMAIIGISSLFLIALIVLSVFFAINASKYETAFGTVILEENDKGRREVSLLYVVEGEAFVEPWRNAPGKWKHDQLVEIEYYTEDPAQIRLRPSFAPYVVGFLFFGITLAGGVLIMLPKKIEEE